MALDAINILMYIFGGILLVLFLFLVFTGAIILISLFKKQKFPNYRPKVSVVIPAYNEEENIEKCIRCVIKSSYPKNLYDITVVDDGSTDNTRKIISKFKNVRILSSGHKGKTAALNYGIAKAKSDIVLTIDADTMLEKDALAKIVKPFADQKVGASIGTYLVANRRNMITAFQSIEYSYNSLIRMAFSRVFSDSVWFYGAMSCYRKSALKKTGYMHSDTLTEDMDISLRLQNNGYKIIHVHDAYSDTVVPHTVSGLFKQRIRWWTGVLQAMKKNKKQSYNKVFGKKKKNDDTSRIPVVFIYLNQWWWSIFSFICVPMYAFQVLYWLPFNLATAMDTFMYLFRWFSVTGPLYSVYMLGSGAWGVSFYSIFGISAGIISVTFITLSLTIFKNRIGFMEVLAIVFYFPYTLLMNIIMMVSVIKYLWHKPKGYVK